MPSIGHPELFSSQKVWSLCTKMAGSHQTAICGAVREALQTASVDQSKYCGHSFRIDAATTTTSRGMEDSIIKTLGRWESPAYLQYVRIPREQLSSYSNMLC